MRGSQSGVRTGREGDWRRSRRLRSTARSEGREPLAEEVLQIVRSRRERAGTNMTLPGEVHLVGVGPGDPGLLTLRAASLMQHADVVLYDRLVSDEVLDLVNPEALQLYVGKSKGFHSKTQEEIQQLLALYASTGATVVRLKGGDPLVFGRGGEEMGHLSSEGVKVRCTTGVTSAAGIAAELCIPLTHRDIAQSVKLLTGHAKSGEEGLTAFAISPGDIHSTLVIYMGLGTAPEVCDRLLNEGFGSTVPAVVVEQGTTEKQRRMFTRLQKMPDHLEETDLRSPALLIIGEVVSLSPLWDGSALGYVQAGSPSYMREHQSSELVSWNELKSTVTSALDSLGW